MWGLGQRLLQGAPQHCEAGGVGVVHSEDEMSETRDVGRLAWGAQFIREGTESGPDAQAEGFSSAGSSSLAGSATRLQFGASLCIRPRLTLSQLQEALHRVCFLPSASMILGLTHRCSPSSETVYHTEPPAPPRSFALTIACCWTGSRPSFSSLLTCYVTLEEGFLPSLNLSICKIGITVPTIKACLKN